MGKKGYLKKVTTTAVNKVENVLWFGFYCKRSRHGNIMTPIRFLIYLCVSLYQEFFFFLRKNITNLFCFKRAHYKVLIFYAFFHGACKPWNDSYVSELHWWRARPETSGDWTDKHHKTALLFIALCFVLNIPLFTFSYRNFLLLLVLPYFDSPRRRTRRK